MTSCIVFHNQVNRLYDRDTHALSTSILHPRSYAAVATYVRAMSPLAEGWMFKSQPRQTLVMKTGSDTSTAKHFAIGVGVTGPRVTVGVAR